MNIINDNTYLSGGTLFSSTVSLHTKSKYQYWFCFYLSYFYHGGLLLREVKALNTTSCKFYLYLHKSSFSWTRPPDSTVANTALLSFIRLHIHAVFCTAVWEKLPDQPQNQTLHLSITICTWYRVFIWAERTVHPFFTHSKSLLLLSADTSTDCTLNIPRSSLPISRWHLSPLHDWPYSSELWDHQ